MGYNFAASQRNEEKIARTLVSHILTTGYTISVYDGEETTVEQAVRFGDVMQALSTTDSDVLRVYDQAGKRIGNIMLVWGNDTDVIADYTDNPEIEALVAPANEYAERL